MEDWDEFERTERRGCGWEKAMGVRGTDPWVLFQVALEFLGLRLTPSSQTYEQRCLVSHRHSVPYLLRFLAA